MRGLKLTDVVDTPGNPLAIDLIDRIVNLLEFVRVGDDLVAGDDVLEKNVCQSLCARLWVEFEKVWRKKPARR